MAYDRNIFDYAPPLYEELRESNALLTAEEAEFARLDASIDDLLAQFRVSTATWGLIEWEKIFGVKDPEKFKYSSFKSMETGRATFDDVQDGTWAEFELQFPKDIEERRSEIKAKLRGNGTVTKQHIQDVINSYANGEVEVLERPRDYTISIRFVSEEAAPYDLDRVKQVIREITPAHLELEFTLAYLLIRDIEGVKTLADMEQLTLDKFAGGVENIG